MALVLIGIGLGKEEKDTLNQKKSENLKFQSSKNPEVSQSENLKGTFFENPENIESQKFTQEKWDFKDRQQSFYEDRYYEFIHGRNTQSIQACTLPDMYIGIITAGQLEKFQVNDIEIRRQDRTQFVTGLYQSSITGVLTDSCFIARITSRGDYELGSYLTMGVNTHNSYCYNLALIPRVNYLVSVGYVQSSAGNKKALIYLVDQNFNQKALKVWANANDAYNTVVGGASEATDVQVAEGDGSIYITGNIENSFTRGSLATAKNCFVMRVDTELNLIFAKSFGVRAVDSQLKCYHLQITRNADYIYFGGEQIDGTDNRLFFAKSNGNGDQMVTTSVKADTSNQFSLSRIILEKGKVLTGTSDILYFCGTLTKSVTDQDFMYGYISSGDVNLYNNDTLAPFQNTLIKVEKIFSYGTSDIEKNSDCALSEDNKNLMALFSTKYHNPQASRIWKTADRVVGYNKGLGINFDFFSDKTPYYFVPTGCNTCRNDKYYDDIYSDMYSFLLYPDPSFAQLSSIQGKCEDPIVSSINNYIAAYESETFSWHQCKNYWWAFSSIADCQINKVHVDFCGAGQTQYTSGCTGCGIAPLCGCCGCGVTSDCSIFVGYANNQRPWYNQNCWRQEQRRNIYRKTLNNGANKHYQQFMFCYDSDSTGGACAEDDEFFLIFEQDCISNGVSQYFFSLFVARFSLDFTITNYEDNNPQIAAYIGDNNGHIESYSIALDQYGFVYIHASSTAPGFGAYISPSGSQIQNSWVHIKTHWELAGEYQYDYTNDITWTPAGTVDFLEVGITQGLSGGAPYTSWWGRTSDFSNTDGDRTPSFMSKKFTIPRKYKNVGASRPPGEQVTFMRVYHDSASAAHSLRVINPWVKSYMMNEQLYTQNVFSFSFLLTNLGLSKTFIWGYAYAKAARAEDIKIYADATNQLGSKRAMFNVPHICSGKNVKIPPLGSSAWDNLVSYRAYINGLYAEQLQTSTTSSDFSLTNDKQFFSLQSVSGRTRTNVELAIEVDDLSDLVEGLYYFDIRVATDDRQTWDYTNKRCLYSNQNFGFFWNTNEFNSNRYTNFRRFEISYRVRILVDQDSIPGPKNIKNIEDIKPVIGLKSELKLKTTPGNAPIYFQGCDRYFAKQQMLSITNAVGVIFNTEALPHWIKFFESNSTFQFYPIIYSPHRIISIELSCCNVIEQCATQTFHVDVQNTPPVSDFAQTNTYVIQHDANEQIGEQFQWEMRNNYFYDIDKASDALNTSNYNALDFANVRTDHTVDMDFTDSIMTFSEQFRHIKRVGLIFGQGKNTIYGVKLLNYQFRDNFVTTPLQLGYLKVLINKMPTVTTVGVSYQLTQIDPQIFGKTTYFDKWFPFLNNDDLLTFEVDTSLWFTDDPTDILTYDLKRSDNTPRPLWIQFDTVNGKMTGFPNLTEKSELLQLKFTVQDQQQGTNKLYKQMLINSKPQASNLYNVIQTGINRQFAYNVSELIWDFNGDPISYSLPLNSDKSKLAAYGISFSDETKLIYGKPVKQGVISLIKLRGTDPHGSYVDVYFTIKIEDYQPNKRSNVRYPDRQLYEYQRFEFQLDDSQFYDPKDYATLVFFAYDPSESPLPPWLIFVPNTRTFSGIAPKRGTEQVIVVRALNIQTHDSLSVTFRIQIVANPNPKTKLAYMPEDLRVVQDKWIDHQIPRLMFQDNNFNYMHKIEMLGANGGKIPSFLSFNQVNRTLFGLANETGIFRLDFVFTDDQGRKTYSNLKLTVTPADYSLPSKYYYHFGFATSALLALLTYLLSLFHFSSHLSVEYKLAETTLKDAAEARKRFGAYHEIEVRFKMPQPRALSLIQQSNLRRVIKLTGGQAGAVSAKTFDYQFTAATPEVEEMDRSMVSVMDKTNENLFKEEQEESKVFESKRESRVNIKEKVLKRKKRQEEQKTKIYSM